MRAAVVAGSDRTGEINTASLTSTDLLVAVDGGAEALDGAGLEPDVLVGDLDSISEHTRTVLQARGVEVVLLPTAKDETDTEAALRLVVERGGDDITVYGALGGPRIDHLMGNLLLLSSPWLASVWVRMVDDSHEAFLARGDSTFEGECGDIVSLLPLTPSVEDVWTEGLLYPLAHEPLSQGATRGVSNVMSATTARVTHGEGVLLLIRYCGR